MGPLLVFHVLCVNSYSERSDCKTSPGVKETEFQAGVPSALREPLHFFWGVEFLYLAYLS